MLLCAEVHLYPLVDLVGAEQAQPVCWEGVAPEQVCPLLFAAGEYQWAQFLQLGDQVQEVVRSVKPQQ